MRRRSRPRRTNNIRSIPRCPIAFIRDVACCVYHLLDERVRVRACGKEEGTGAEEKKEAKATHTTRENRQFVHCRLLMVQVSSSLSLSLPLFKLQAKHFLNYPCDAACRIRRLQCERSSG